MILIDDCPKPAVSIVRFAKPSDPQYKNMTHIRRTEPVCFPSPQGVPFSAIPLENLVTQQQSEEGGIAALPSLPSTGEPNESLISREDSYSSVSLYVGYAGPAYGYWPVLSVVQVSPVPELPIWPFLSLGLLAVTYRGKK